jgi:hypothetical protein
MNYFNLRYWLCQILGWGIWGLILSYFNLIVYADRFTAGGKKEFCISLTILLVTGIIITHLARLGLKKINWVRFQVNKIILLFTVAVVVTGAGLFFSANFLEKIIPNTFDRYQKDKRFSKAVSLEKEFGLNNTAYYAKAESELDPVMKKNIAEIKKTLWTRNKNGNWVYDEMNDLLIFYQYLILTALWMLLYIAYHYVENNRKSQLDKLKLETTVKELELKTIKSHINPHFIFNSLNSIRALVDENPSRARTAITELSNILRSSMQAEKLETVPLKNELSIVKDYLELEHMRFEERLRVEMDIDKDTLEQPVPPMMLQTLVENAIKHGISKNVAGGYIKVISGFTNQHHELTVLNSGQIMGYYNGSLLTENQGFGIKSTEDRLNLLYQGKAFFSIKNLDAHSVESKVTLPVTVK